MNQTATSDQQQQSLSMQSLASMLLTPITGPVAYLSAVRGFIYEMPDHQRYYSTNLFQKGEFELLGPKWLKSEERRDSDPSIFRNHYFLQKDIRHLALSANGIVIVKEIQNSSTKGDRPDSRFEIVGRPTRRDVISLARVTSYEEVKQLAVSVISNRNQLSEHRLSGFAPQSAR